MTYKIWSHDYFLCFYWWCGYDSPPHWQYDYYDVISTGNLFLEKSDLRGFIRTLTILEQTPYYKPFWSEITLNTPNYSWPRSKLEKSAEAFACTQQKPHVTSIVLFVEQCLVYFQWPHCQMFQTYRIGNVKMISSDKRGIGWTALKGHWSRRPT